MTKLDDDFPIRGWSRDTSIVFRKTREEWGGLSNMAAGFPIEVNDVEWSTSEALYQALRFPDHPEVQEMIRAEKGPMSAKMKSKPFRAECSRRDWDDIRIDVMYWCLQSKLVANEESFGALLRSTGKLDVVEDSSKDRFWGAVAANEERLEGRNVLGVLIMRLRRDYLLGDALWQSDRIAVPGPPFGRAIIGGKELSAGSIRALSRKDTLF